MQIFIYGEYEPWQKEFLFRALGDFFDFSWGTELPVPANYNILISGRPPEKFISAAGHLKYLIIPYAGVSFYTAKLVSGYPQISLHNLHHNALPTAEMAFSLLLAAAKNIIPAHNKLGKGDWTPRYEGLANPLIAGKNVLILGLGSVGRLVADMCLGMKARVFATRLNIKETTIIDNVEIHSPQDLDSLLTEADFLVVTLPLTKDTENILDYSRLCLLPPNAVLVNIGRAGLINEKALYRILKKKKIAAAALDVWYNYPQSMEDRTHTFPGNYPFHELDNIVLSPHRGGSFANYDTELLRVKHLSDMLLKFHHTGDMPNKVDLKRGY
jgi:phosphoglycerate dehydrogenase-like enzyme